MPISFLKQKGYLGPHAFGGKIFWWIRKEAAGNIWICTDALNTTLTCRYTRTPLSGDPIDYDYPIRLVTTPCYFGGVRYWYLCPLKRDGVTCGARVGVLYMEEGLLGCRKCHNLAYSTQQETHTSKWNVLKTCWALERRCETQMEKIRVKYWKGQPTKRYRKVLRDFHRLEMLTPLMENMKF